MADSWTTPGTWNNEVLADGKLNANMRDNPEALHMGLTGDRSADADVWQAIKSGTLAGRAGVTHKVGRQYQATDCGGQTFASDGTNWRHVGGPGPYDDFKRNSTTITPSASGHVWSEVVGDWEVAGDLLKVNSAGDHYAALDTGSLLNRSYIVNAGFLTQATQSGIALAVIPKFVDANNYLYVDMKASVLSIGTRIAGGFATLASLAFSPGASTPYLLDVQVYGQAVLARLNSGTTFSAYLACRHANVQHAALASATKVGFSTPNTAERFSNIAVNF